MYKTLSKWDILGIDWLAGFLPSTVSVAFPFSNDHSIGIRKRITRGMPEARDNTQENKGETQGIDTHRRNVYVIWSVSKE